VLFHCPPGVKQAATGCYHFSMGASGNAHIAIARKSRENASGRKSGRRRREGPPGETQTNRGSTSKPGNADDGRGNGALFFIEEDTMQQVVLCFDWCVLGWMFSSTNLQPPVAELNWKAGCVERRTPEATSISISGTQVLRMVCANLTIYAYL
jgi:hypothetical protein